MEDTLQKGAEFKKNIERISSQLQTQKEMVESHPNKEKAQLSSKQVQSQEVQREEQMVPLLQISQREKAKVQVPHIQQVNPTPLDDIEIHDIDSDLEEETGPSTCLVSILTSLVSSIPNPEESEFVLGASFSQHSFSEINISPIMEPATTIPTILVDSPIHTSSPPHSPPHLIPTSPLS